MGTYQKFDGDLNIYSKIETSKKGPATYTLGGFFRKGKYVFADGIKF